MKQPPEPIDLPEKSGVALEERPKQPTQRPRPVGQAPSTLPPTPAPEEEEDSFLVRHKGLLIIGLLVIVGGVWLMFFHKSGNNEPVRKAPEAKTVTVQLPPPPTPPPVPTPPPKVIPPPPKDEKRMETAPVEKPKEVEAPKPTEKPPEGLGTNNKGPGPGMAGLGSSGNGVIGGAGSGSGGGGSLARWYAGQFQTKLNSALRDNPKTRKAKGSVKVSLWVDDSGKVTRSELSGSTGDAAIESTLKEQILSNLRAAEPPPKGMKMPITYRVVLSRDR